MRGADLERQRHRDATPARKVSIGARSPLTPVYRATNFVYDGPSVPSAIAKPGLRRSTSTHAAGLLPTARGLSPSRAGSVRSGPSASARSSRATSSAGTSGWRPAASAAWLIATAIITVMYVGLCFSIAEMSPALPHTGGAYSFARSSMGPWGAYVTGLAENMEYVLTPGGDRGGDRQLPRRDLRDTPEVAWAPLWWLAVYAMFVGLNVAWASRRPFASRSPSRCSPSASWRSSGSARSPTSTSSSSPSTFAPRPAAAVPALRLARRAGRPALRVWFYLAIESCRSPRRRRTTPKRDMPRGILLGPRHARRVRVPHALPVERHRAGRGGAGHLGGAALRRASARSSARASGPEAAGGARGGRPGGELPLHRVRLRPPALLALAGGLLPALALRHASRPARRPMRALRGGRRHRLRGRARHPYGTCRSDHPVGRGAPEHGRLRSRASPTCLQMASFVLLRIRLPGLERPVPESRSESPGAVVAGAGIALRHFRARCSWTDPDVSQRRGRGGASGTRPDSCISPSMPAKTAGLLAPEEAFAGRRRCDTARGAPRRPPATRSGFPPRIGRDLPALRVPNLGSIRPEGPFNR